MMLGRLIRMLLGYIFGFEKLEKGSPEDTKLQLSILTWLLFNVVIVYGLLLNHVPKSQSSHKK